MPNPLREYLKDPFLNRLYKEIRKIGPMKSISLDLNQECNIRCTGCYYFFEGMDVSDTPNDESEFDAFIERELERGTNFVTVVGGEPSIRLDRLKKIYDNFKMNVSTNGIIPIPKNGFENMPIGVSIWGDHKTDAVLRGNGKRDIFSIALNNYSPHFRAYNADFKTTRRCCVGIERSCDSCFDVWNHFSWVMLNMKKHLGSKQEFTNWLTSMYLFYLINRLVDYETGIHLLPEIHKRVSGLKSIPMKNQWVFT